MTAKWCGVLSNVTCRDSPGSSRYPVKSDELSQRNTCGTNGWRLCKKEHHGIALVINMRVDDVTVMVFEALAVCGAFTVKSCSKAALLRFTQCALLCCDHMIKR